LKKKYGCLVFVLLLRTQWHHNEVVISSFSFPPIHLLTFHKASARIERTKNQHLVFDLASLQQREKGRD